MNFLIFAVFMTTVAIANMAKHDIKISQTDSDSRVYQEGPTSPKPPETPKGVNGPAGENQ